MPGLLKSHRDSAKAGVGAGWRRVPDTRLQVNPHLGLCSIGRSGSWSTYESSVSLLFIFIPNSQHEGFIWTRGWLNHQILQSEGNWESLAQTPIWYLNFLCSIFIQWMLITTRTLPSINSTGNDGEPTLGTGQPGTVVGLHTWMDHGLCPQVVTSNWEHDK